MNQFFKKEPIKAKIRFSFICSIPFFTYLAIFPLSLVIADDFNSSLSGLRSKSRTEIKQAVINLGELGDPKALPVLEALKNKLLGVDTTGRLIILNEVFKISRRLFQNILTSTKIVKNIGSHFWR